MFFFKLGRIVTSESLFFLDNSLSNKVQSKYSRSSKIHSHCNCFNLPVTVIYSIVALNI